MDGLVEHSSKLTSIFSETTKLAAITDHDRVEVYIHLTAWISGSAKNQSHFTRKGEHRKH
jgi:putative ubiquitin-RnfH superfamily antitoxin RatB of RatAB toxin-antitoxin module